MPCGVPKPLRGRPEARRPGVCLPFEEWAEKKKSISQYLVHRPSQRYYT